MGEKMPLVCDPNGADTVLPWQATQREIRFLLFLVSEGLPKPHGRDDRICHSESVVPLTVRLPAVPVNTYKASARRHKGTWRGSPAASFPSPVASLVDLPLQM